MTESWFEIFVFKALVPAMVGFAILSLMGVVFMIYSDLKVSQNCLRWETKTEYQNSYYTYIYTGKVMVPIYHAGRDVEHKVCTEVKNATN